MTREEAIDTLKAMQALQEIYRNEAVDMAIEALSERTGKWVRKDMYASRFCSKCDYAVGADESEEYNFCPNCGAMMDHKEK